MKSREMQHFTRTITACTGKPQHKDGIPLAFVQELRSYVSGLNDKIEKQTSTKAKTKAEGEAKKENKKASSGDGGEPPDDKTAASKLTPKQKANLNKIREILEKNIEPMPENIEFTKENFDKLFKNGINSPIEHIKIGENQFEKLKAKNREDLLAPMSDVLSNPAIIIKTVDNAKLYVKTYKGI